MDRRLNLTDATIQIRIMKALEDTRPFGLFKNFYMIRALRNLKQPNIITAQHIWEFLLTGFEAAQLDATADAPVFSCAGPFENVFND